MFKEIEHPKITITDKRVSFKVPISMSLEESNAIFKKFLIISEKIGVPKLSLRGTLNAGKNLIIKSSNGQIVHVFNFDTLEPITFTLNYKSFLEENKQLEHASEMGEEGL